MHIFDLPPELFAALAEQTVHTLGLQRTLRARLISKTFDAALTSAIFATTAIEREYASAPSDQRDRVIARPFPAKWAAGVLCARLKRRAASALTPGLEPQPEPPLLAVAREVVRRVGEAQEQGREESSAWTHDDIATAFAAAATAWDLGGNVVVAELVAPEEEERRDEWRNRDTSAAGVVRVCCSVAAWLGDEGLVAYFLSVWDKDKDKESDSNSDSVSDSDINDDPPFLGPPLWAAASRGHERIVRDLLARGASPVEAAFDTEWPYLSSASPVIAASATGNLALVRLLHGACSEAAKVALASSVWPVRKAAEGGDEAVVGFWLGELARVQEAEAEAEAEAGKAKEVTEEEEEQAQHERHDARALLLDAALLGACWHSHVPLASSLLAQGASTDALDTYTDAARKYTPLDIAVVRGCAPLITLLAVHGAVDDIHHSYNAPTALQIAASRGHTAAVMALLEAGAPVYRARGPLRVAAERGWVGTVKAILDSGFDVGRWDPYFDQEPGALGREAVFWAVVRGYGDVVRVLGEGGCDVNGARWGGREVMVVEARRSGHEDVVKVLLELGVVPPVGFESVKRDEAWAEPVDPEWADVQDRFLPYCLE
ncbi:uncharacterized protein K452DRAFT_114054 [Aplosporella prunicola CBS 121167]|uniref:Uncharacterized protein n=1 Tax=Aplosporella prunicola CBS 121167 TaxID=1176127 RepID=A0A6A6B2W9_9PEZI|nr:uncharacterized protein K452DRAFT_114054 [Aplosporella prunicola CBS 121167]KAF2137071.1 hypothetical protein K452DRAFT_114054 [Aplosporella prunicola CBS 121167]